MADFEPEHELGRTGFRATRLGAGDLADRQLPLETCVATLRRALDAGINLVDTAPAYEDGFSEEIVGAALRGRRDGIFVIDKVDHPDSPVAPQVDGSLTRLNMDHVDCFVFHAISKMEQWERLTRPAGGLEQLEACMRAGKARFCGISSHHPDVCRAALQSARCDVLMFPVGPFVHSRYIEEILPLAKERGVGSVCFKTFGAGKLVGDTTGYNRPLAKRPRGKLSSGGSDAGEPALPHLSVSECVRYTLTLRPDVALLGLSFPNEQDAAFTAARNFTPMSPAELKETRRRALSAIQGKGDCWWNPPA